MSSYTPTHLPYGLLDSTRRIIRNPGIKDEVEFLKYGIETNGEYFLVRALVEPGCGVPLHRHYSYGETMSPVEGELGVVGHNGTKTMILKKGESYTVKQGEWHRFFNPSSDRPMKFDAKVVPAHQGFEKMLYIWYGIAADGLGDSAGAPKSTFHLLLLMHMGDYGQPGLIGRLFGSAATIARWIAWLTGVEESLTSKYYGKPVSEATEEERTRWHKKDL